MTPEWLTEVLHEAGLIEAGACVTSCELGEIGIGRGFTGIRLRARLSYEPTGAGPASLVAKLPTVLEMAREGDLALIAWIYSTEINFYRNLAPRCPARTPLHYWSGTEPDDRRYCLLIEDMGDLREAGQLVSCSAKDARLAVSTLARVHAEWWHDEQLRRQEWLSGFEANGRLFAGLYAQGWDHFWAMMGEALPPEYEAPGRALATRYAEMVEEGTHSAWTLVHGDFCLENVLFDDDHEEPLVLLDWQTASWGSGLLDLGYFMGQSLSTELRRAQQPELLRCYYDKLREHGVNGYSFDQMMHDYRLGLLLATASPVNGARMLVEQKEQGFDYLEPKQRDAVMTSFKAGEELLRERAMRNVAAILDNAAQELL
jgi:hypothetical protein